MPHDAPSRWVPRDERAGAALVDVSHWNHVERRLRLERALGLVLWLALAAVLVLQAR